MNLFPINRDEPLIQVNGRYIVKIPYCYDPGYRPAMRVITITPMMIGTIVANMQWLFRNCEKVKEDYLKGTPKINEEFLK